MKTLAILATLLLSSAAAFAQPVLKSDIVVASALVTVGDMFDNAGPLAEQSLFRAPLPGTTGNVAVADIEAAARRAGLDTFSTNGISSVRVVRKSTIIDELALSQAISTDLVSRGILSPTMSADTRFANPISPINAEATEAPLQLVSLRYLPGSAAFTARFTIAGRAAPLDVSGTIDLMIEAPHLAATRPSGSVLTPADIVMRKIPVRFADGSGFADAAHLVGKALQRQSREGTMLRAADVAEPLIISRNQPVTLYFRRGPMTLSVKGQALGNAASGTPVQVLNLMSKRVVSGVAIGPGAVEILAAPLAVAGL